MDVALAGVKHFYFVLVNIETYDLEVSFHEFTGKGKADIAEPYNPDNCLSGGDFGQETVFETGTVLAPVSEHR